MTITTIVAHLGLWLSVLSLAVSIFRDQISRTMGRARLKLSVKQICISDSWKHVANGEAEKTPPALWYHARATNPNRPIPTSDVCGMLLRVEGCHNNGERVFWKGEAPLSWRYQVYKSTTLGLGPPQDIDLFSSHEDGHLRLHPQVQHPAGLLEQFKGPLDLVVVAKAMGRECESNRIFVRITWDGEVKPEGDGFTTTAATVWGSLPKGREKDAPSASIRRLSYWEIVRELWRPQSAGTPRSVDGAVDQSVAQNRGITSSKPPEATTGEAPASLGAPTGHGGRETYSREFVLD